MERDRRGVDSDMEETEVVIVLDIPGDSDTAVGVKGIADGLRKFWGKG